MVLQIIVRQNVQTGSLLKCLYTVPYSSARRKSVKTTASKSNFSTGLVFTGNKQRTIIHTEQQILGYSCDQMFNVVSEVQNYHRFVPWCKKSNVVYSDEESLDADLVIGFPPLFGESYKSHVKLFKPHLITAVCTDMTMFDHLKTVWKLEHIPKEKQFCRLDFAVSFAFRSRIHSYFAQRFLDDVIKQNVNAFLKEAKVRYGKEIYVPDEVKNKYRSKII